MSHLPGTPRAASAAVKRQHSQLSSQGENNSPVSRFGGTDSTSHHPSSARGNQHAPGLGGGTFASPHSLSDNRNSHRVTEVSFLTEPSPSEYILDFEGSPVWLLGLDMQNCSKVYFVGSSSPGELVTKLSHLGVEMALYHQVVTHLGLQRTVWLGDRLPPRGVPVLVSGSLDYLRSRSLKWTSHQTLLLFDRHWLGRRFPHLTGYRWIRCRHASLGGCTQFVSLLGYQEAFDFLLPTVGLRRQIAHIVDHGVAPTHNRPPPGTPVLTDECLLPPTPARCWITYQTGRLKGAMMIRQITDAEVAIAFGLPPRLCAKDIKLEWIPPVPVPLLQAMLRGITVPTAFISGAQARRTPRHLPHTLPIQTWLPQLGRHLSHAWVDMSTVTDKAVKSDDADVPTQLWEQRVTLPLSWVAPGFAFLRRKMQAWQSRDLWCGFRAYMTTTHGVHWATCLALARRRGPNGTFKGGKGSTSSTFSSALLQDAKVGAEVLSRFSVSSWWDWRNGSTLVFWRWLGPHQLEMARDGMPAWLTGRLPKNLKRARPAKAETFDLIAGKLEKILERTYVEVKPPSHQCRNAQFVKSFMDYFAVPKGSDDIRMVYNGSSCGLNAVLWAPRFWLPTPRTATRVLNYNYCGVDIDLGEMFLNFPLSEVLRAFSGIDISQFKEKLGFQNLTDEEFEVRWTRCWMGLRPSPFFAIRFYYWAEEFARGDHRDRGNFLGWTKVLLNLPGDEAFDPSLPFVMKWNDSINNIAGDVCAFVDDLRASGHNEEASWGVARQVASRLQYLGIQDAPRKRRPPARLTGAWAGAIFNTSNGKISQSVSQEKWDKAKGILRDLREEMERAPQGKMNYKRLERARGFLGHLSMTFEIIAPFLKGFHLTLASHLPMRDGEGWKMSEPAWDAYIQQRLDEGKMSEDQASEAWAPPHYNDTKPPKVIKPVEMFAQCLLALDELFEQKEPPEVAVRSNRVYQVLYGFGDASGQGYGSTVLSKLGLRIRIGLWGKDTDGASSNWREFENVVEALEAEGQNLKGAMIFFFTDNSSVESALYKGNSSSPELFKLVVRFRKLEMAMGCKIFVSHVSGKRMIAQGSDGVSRGHLSEGVAAGEEMLSFVPLHMDPISRSPLLETWIRSWAGKEVEFLSPEGWFTRGHDHYGGSRCGKGFWRPTIKPATFVWSLPPAAAIAGIEELRKARIKRQDSTHVVVCPRLFTPQWLKQLHKTADMIVTIPAGSSFWSMTMHEPLILALVCPYISSPPWHPRGTPKIISLERELRKMLPEQDVLAGDLLRKFLLAYWKVRTLPEDVVRSVLYFEPRHPVPRPNNERRTRYKRSGPKRPLPAGEGVGQQTANKRKLSYGAGRRSSVDPI